MKGNKILLALMALLLVGCSQATPKKTDTDATSDSSNSTQEVSGEFAIDPALSTVRWEGKKILVPSKHTGTIQIAEGILVAESGRLSKGEFTIDMTTINNEDLEGEGKAKLEGHLKSADFFDVEKFPTANLKINEATLGEDGQYKVKADLTIKGITKPIEFDATSTLEGETLKSEAEIEINRTLWDIRFGSGTFFKDLGDKVIDDLIAFQVSLVGKKK